MAKNRIDEEFGIKLPADTLMGCCENIRAVASLVRLCIAGASGSNAATAGTQVEDWALECALDSTVRRNSPDTAQDAHSTQATNLGYQKSHTGNAAHEQGTEIVLVTGTTGFMGAAVLRELVETYQPLTLSCRPRTQLVCLVRCSSNQPGAALKALTAALARRMQLTDLIRYRMRDGNLVAARGDLAEPWLGLTTEQRGTILPVLSRVLHIGAAVNHVSPYHALKQTNCDSATEIARLAAHARKPVTVVNVSTVDTVNEGQTEADVCDPAALGNSGYAQSKAVAERRLLEASANGVCCLVIVRTGYLSFDTRTGSCNHAGWLSRVLAGSLKVSEPFFF